MNNKSRIALAIAAAFGTVALGVSSGATAQTSTVQIGGGINMKYALHRNTGGLPSGSKNSSNDNLSLQEPEMWIHGEEKIGGVTAWFRCSSSFDVLGAGGGTQATPAGTAAAPSTSQFCGRNSAIGFKGGWGNIFFGNWDSPTKNVSGPVRGWFSSTDSLVGGFGNVVLNTSSSNTTNVNATQASWTERRQRQIRYDSPSFSGFAVSGAYTAANESTGLSSAASQNLTAHGGFLPNGIGPVLTGAVAATGFYFGADAVHFVSSTNVERCNIRVLARNINRLIHHLPPHIRVGTRTNMNV